MALVVFLRGANLGKRRFQPAAIAKKLGLTNLGAAGTFVAKRKMAESTLRAKIQAEIPWEAPMVIATAEEVLAAVRAGDKVDVPDGARRFATALGEAPTPRPDLPIVAPAAGAWGVRIEALEGRFAIGVRRRTDEGGVYGTEALDKLGTLATSRDWPTMEKIAKVLEEDA